MGLTTQTKNNRPIVIAKPFNKARMFMSYDEAVADNKRIADARERMADIQREISMTPKELQERATKKLSEQIVEKNPLPKKKPDVKKSVAKEVVPETQSEENVSDNQ